MRIKITFIIAIILVFSFSAATFEKIEFRDDNYFNANPGEYDKLLEELSSMISFNQDGPAESLGLIGLNIKLNLKMAAIDDKSGRWNNAVKIGTLPSSSFICPQLIMTKGLPNDIDISAMYMPVIGADLTIGGVAVKWAFIDGGALIPAVALRASYSTALEKTNFKMEDIDLNLSISKDLGIITPYAFAGCNYGRISNVKTAINPIKNNDKTTVNYGAGASLSLGLININASVCYDKKMIYSISTGLGF